jgi:putative restriction endonuclease
VTLTTQDAQLGQAVFDQVNRLAALRGGVLDSIDLAGGFEFGGERIPLINPRRGIFKPRQMAHLLSIKTVFPRRDARVWCDDQREAHRQIYAGDEVVDAFMGTDPNSPDNRWLRDAMERQIPVIYFLGTSPGRYQPIIPTFIVGWHPERLRVALAFGALVGASAQAALPEAPERQYALHEFKALPRGLYAVVDCKQHEHDTHKTTRPSQSPTHRPVVSLVNTIQNICRSASNSYEDKLAGEQYARNGDQ